MLIINQDFIEKTTMFESSIQTITFGIQYHRIAVVQIKNLLSAVSMMWLKGGFLYFRGHVFCALFLVNCGSRLQCP